MVLLWKNVVQSIKEFDHLELRSVYQGDNMSFTEEEIVRYEHGPDCKSEDLEEVAGHPDVKWCETCQGYFQKDTDKPLPVMDKRFL